jgi:hypothetical protein
MVRETKTREDKIKKEYKKGQVKEKGKRNKHEGI